MAKHHKWRVPGDPWRRLAAGIVKTAVMDVQHGNERADEARRWLLFDPLCVLILDELGIDRRRVVKWTLAQLLQGKT